jgi:hypothetical protein
MATTGRVDVIGTVPTIVAREILKYTKPNLELWKRMNMSVAGGVSVGDRVQVPTYLDANNTPDTGAAAATQLHTGTASGFSGTIELDPLVATYADQTIGSVTIFLAHWFYVAMELSEYAKATAQGDLVALFRQAGLDTLAVRMDTTVANLIATFDSPAPRGTLGTALTDDLILDGISDLDNGNVPSDGRAYVFSAQEKANYFKIDKYVNSLTRGDTKPLTKGELGNLYGMPWSWTTNVPAPAAGQHRNFLFHRDAVGCMTRKAPMAKVVDSPDPQFAQRIVSMAIWGANEMRERFGVELDGV